MDSGGLRRNFNHYLWLEKMDCREPDSVKIAGSEARLHVVFQVVGQVAEEPVWGFVHEFFQRIEGTTLGFEANLRSSPHGQQALVLASSYAVVAVAVQVANRRLARCPLEGPLLEIVAFRQWEFSGNPRQCCVFIQVPK